MNRKKRSLIISCIVVSLLLAGIGSISYVFYSMAVSATVVKETIKVKSVPSTTSTVIDSAGDNEAVPVKSLYSIYVSSKWSRIKCNGQQDYLADQYIALNTEGSVINKYPSNYLGTTKVETPLKTGPGVSYSDVLRLPLGKSLEFIGEIINPAGEKWLMYKYAYAIYYVAASDIEIIVQPISPAPPTTNSRSTTPTTTTKPATPNPPITPPSATTTNAQKIVDLAYSKLGFAYVYGATGPNSFDCSGFVYWVVNNSGIPGLSVPRTSIALYTKFSSYNIGTSVANAKPGDIILFSKDGTASGISHSAIYYKDSKMIHASEPSTGVILTTVAYSTSNKSVFAIIRLPGC